MGGVTGPDAGIGRICIAHVEEVACAWERHGYGDEVRVES